MESINENNHRKVPHERGSYWKRAHHDWRFWVGFVLMLAAIIYYIVSIDFTIRTP